MNAQPVGYIGAPVSNLFTRKVSAVKEDPRVVTMRGILWQAEVAYNTAERNAKGRDDPNVAKAKTALLKAQEGLAIELAEAENLRRGLTPGMPGYVLPKFTPEQEARRKAEFDAGQKKIQADKAANAAKLEAERKKYEKEYADANRGNFLTRAVGSAGKALATGVSAASEALGDIPIVGPGLEAVYDLAAAPITLTTDIAQGKRIDKAFIASIEQQVQSFKAVAPYAQMVCSLVPGVGTGLAAAIGAASALASGQPIDAAIMAGVRGALPGGPLAAAAFDVAVAAVQGKPIDVVLVNALPIDPAAKQAVITALQAAKDLAAGKPIDEALLAAGRSYMPPEMQQALDIGIAIAHGQNLQTIAERNLTDPKVIGKLAAIGGSAAGKVVAGGREVLGKVSAAAETGFNVGVGLMAHSGVTAPAIGALRSVMPPDAVKGFDTALATFNGLVQMKPPASITEPVERFAYAAASGLSGASAPMKASVVNTITTVAPQAAPAVLAASEDVINLGRLRALEAVKRMQVMPNGRIARLKAAA